MKVSIIIPVHNVENYIGKCLKSLIELNGRVIELLCIDDGSTDESAKVVEKYKSIDDRIRLITKENGGASSARNYGIEQAKGDWLIFVDGDDYIFPEILESMLDTFEEVKNIDAVWTGYVRCDWNGEHQEHTKLPITILDNEKIIEILFPRLLGNSYEQLYSWFKGEKLLLSEQEFPAVWRGIYSKKIIDDFNIRFNESVMVGEDLLFNWDYYVHVNKVYVTDYNYYCYVWRDGSLTQNSANFFYESKKKFIIERNLQNKRILLDTHIDFSKEYQGSLVLTKLQMALTLSNCRISNVFANYKKFDDYSKLEIILDAYENLELKEAPLKYKLIFGVAKNNWNRFLFLGCFLLNKMNLHIYPE